MPLKFHSGKPLSCVFQRHVKIRRTTPRPLIVPSRRVANTSQFNNAHSLKISVDNNEQISAHASNSSLSSLEKIPIGVTTPPIASSPTNDQLSPEEELIIRHLYPIVSDDSNMSPTNDCKSAAINRDEKPVVIAKQPDQIVPFTQFIGVKYLKPETPPPPGDLIIQKGPDVACPPLEPLIIRQQPARCATPEPIVFREAPPTPPPIIERKVIKISGKQLPPPPRKVIFEQLPQIPVKPRPIIIEKWLPYERVERKIIIEKIVTPEPQVQVEPPKNLIVKWLTPDVKITRKVTFLGAQRANPESYAQKYGSELKTFDEIKNLLVEHTMQPADNKAKLAVELEGALRLHESRVQQKLIGKSSGINFIMRPLLNNEVSSSKSMTPLHDVSLSSVKLLQYDQM